MATGGTYQGPNTYKSGGSMYGNNDTVTGKKRYIQPPGGAWNEEVSYTAYCANGYAGNPVTITIPSNTLYSVAGVSAATAQALAVATAQAEALLVCILYPGFTFLDESPFNFLDGSTFSFISS